jgi:hypothetical protein
MVVKINCPVTLTTAELKRQQTTDAHSELQHSTLQEGGQELVQEEQEELELELELEQAGDILYGK